MELIEWIQRLAQSAGPVGLFLLSIADSAGIPTGGGPDVLLVLQSSIVDHTRTVAVLVAIAAVGSTAGCLAMYYVGRRSGRVALRRFSEQRVEGIRRRLKRHGPWVIFLAVMAPPPYPTKLFVLCAGVFGMRPIPFGLSTLVGRLIRYGMGGYLGMRFGTEGLELVHQHAVWIGGVFLFLMMAAVVFALLRRKLRTGKDSSA